MGHFVIGETQLAIRGRSEASVYILSFPVNLSLLTETMASLVLKTTLKLPATFYTTRASPSSLCFPIVKFAVAKSLSTISRQSFSVPKAMTSLVPKTVTHKLPTPQTTLVPRAYSSSASFPTVAKLVAVNPEASMINDVSSVKPVQLPNKTKKPSEVATLVAVKPEASTMDDVPSVKPIEMSKKKKEPGEIGEGVVVHTDEKHYLILEKEDLFMYLGTCERIIKYCIEKGLIDGIGAGDTVVFEVVNDSNCLIIKLLEKSTESSREKVNRVCRYLESTGVSLPKQTK